MNQDDDGAGRPMVIRGGLESKIQAVVGARHYGRSLTTHIEQLGLLGPRFVAAHGVWLDVDDMRRLGAHGASIAHNPASNMRLGNGIADAVGMLEAGVNLAIGTDAATCNDNLNMYQSLHFAAAASHARGPDPARWITAPQGLRRGNHRQRTCAWVRADRANRARLCRRYRVPRS
jgi:5-methylthioadenosine/S-adenosylhomocysteine deaminase